MKFKGALPRALTYCLDCMLMIFRVGFKRHITEAATRVFCKKRCS